MMDAVLLELQAHSEQMLSGLPIADVGEHFRHFRLVPKPTSIFSQDVVRLPQLNGMPEEVFSTLAGSGRP